MNARISFADYHVFEIIHGCCAHAFPWHFHRFNSFITVNGGQVEVLTGTRTVRLKQGDSGYIAAFIPHALIPVNGANYAYTTLCLKTLPLKAFKHGGDCFDKAASYLHSHAGAKLSLDTLCQHCHISEFHLIRRFKARFGLTPHQYHASLRIAKIRQGLVLRQSLSDLTYALGFADQSHMCNVFKKYMGLTPRQYQKAYKRFTAGPVQRLPEYKGLPRQR